MNKAIQFGEQVEGYEIPVLNEREIRASIFFALMVVVFGFIAFIVVLAMSTNDYFSIKPYDMFGINTPR